jgi:hypothetical protein
MGDIIERLEGMPSGLNDAFRTMQEASQEIQTLRSRVAQAEAQIETSREQASEKDAEPTFSALGSNNRDSQLCRSISSRFAEMLPSAPVKAYRPPPAGHTRC